MTGSLEALFAATVFFVAGHFVLSSAPIRGALVRRFGEGPFMGMYAVVVFLAFVWMLLAYRAAPTVEVWPFVPGLAWVPVVAMPVAIFLAVCAFSTPNPTLAGAEGSTEPGHPAPGIISVTRHPFLWGAALWAASHLVVNGNAADIVMMGGLLILVVGGMFHIDKKREARLGAAWGPIAMTTSLVPFVAMVTKRTRFDWAGIGWWRVTLALAIYVAIVFGHEFVFGVAPFPR